jgi:hypothetical protein
MGFLPAVAGLLGVWTVLALSAIACAIQHRIIHDARQLPIMLRVLASDLRCDCCDADAEAVCFCMRKRGASGSTVPISIQSLANEAFGGRIAVFCSFAFTIQMFSMLIAQIVKGGELLGLISGWPYAVCCLGPAAAIGAFTYRAHSISVQRLNTGLTAAIMGAFALLVRNTLSSVGSGADASGAWARLATAQWSLLLPSANTATSWPVPIFLQVINFGMAVPIVVQGMHATRSARHVRRARRAILLGAMLPLLIGLIWTGVVLIANPASATQAAADPVLVLLAARPAISIPVRVLSCAAIATTCTCHAIVLGSETAPMDIWHAKPNQWHAKPNLICYITP